MQPFNLAAPWDEVKEKLKEINIDLTDDDLIYHRGKEDELIARLRQKIKGTPEEIRGLVESISFNEGKAG
jgi:uncharacterized protein YjbJ (UPF0337 family)